MFGQSKTGYQFTEETVTMKDFYQKKKWLADRFKELQLTAVTEEHICNQMEIERR